MQHISGNNIVYSSNVKSAKDIKVKIVSKSTIVVTRKSESLITNFIYTSVFLKEGLQTL